MEASQLKIGDRIRIIGVPGDCIPDYYIHPDTVRIFKKLIARKRSLRIRSIDEHGQPWYECKFKNRDGTWEWHSLAVGEGENNWVPVTRRMKPKRKS
jgi:hypothetical protein